MLAQRTKDSLLAKICENAHDGTFILDSQLRYLWVNDSFLNTINHSTDDFLERYFSFNKYKHLSKNDQITLQVIIDSLDKVGYFHDSLTIQGVDNVKIDATVTVWRVDYEKTVYYIGILKDISSATAIQNSLTQLKYYNQVTGLPNRLFFINQLSEYLVDTYQELVLVRMSIDRFDILSQAFTESELNILVNQIVTRINRLSLSNLVTFAQFNESSFALLFEMPNAEDAGIELDLIMQQFELPFVVVDERIYVHVSIGASKYRQDASQMDKLIRCAERALTQAKSQGGDSIVWFKHDICNDTLYNIQLEAQVRQALLYDEFIPYYQPKYHLKTGAIAGFEALVRWSHPTRGILSPQHFLNVIIEARLSFDLYCNMALMVAAQMSQWAGMGIGSSICVNTDAAEFRDSEFLDFTLRVLADYDILPNQFHIEMTESSLMVNDELSLRTINAIKNAGIYIALDDFGTGYASLSYLHHYPFDYVKIDKSFVQDILVNDKQYNIVKAIITMAHNLGMEVVAEGVESEAQAKLLQELGCEYGQGYYFGRPMTAEDATKLLLEHERKQA